MCIWNSAIWKLAATSYVCWSFSTLFLDLIATTAWSKGVTVCMYPRNTAPSTTMIVSVSAILQFSLLEFAIRWSPSPLRHSRRLCTSIDFSYLYLYLGIHSAMISSVPSIYRRWYGAASRYYYYHWIHNAALLLEKAWRAAQVMACRTGCRLFRYELQLGTFPVASWNISDRTDADNPL